VLSATKLSNETPIASLPAGQYRASVARSFGKPGRCRIGTPDHPLASLAVGGRHIAHAVFQHAGGEIGLACDPGVRPLIELQLMEET